MPRKFAITGHPRSGTGYMAGLMQCFGFDVRHEKMGVNGCCAWSWGTLAPKPPWSPGCPRPLDWELIKVVRDPRQCLWSIAYSFDDPKHANYIREYIVQVPGWSAIDNAAMSWLCWNKVIDAQQPDLVVPVERAPGIMSEWLELPIPDELPVSTWNSKPKRTHDPRPDDSVAMLRPEMRDEVVRYAGHLYPLEEAVSA